MMRFEDLPIGAQELLSGLKKASMTIENDVNDALRDASHLNDFIDKAGKYLVYLADEAIDWKEKIESL